LVVGVRLEQNHFNEHSARHAIEYALTKLREEGKKEKIDRRLLKETAK